MYGILACAFAPFGAGILIRTQSSMPTMYSSRIGHLSLVLALVFLAGLIPRDAFAALPAPGTPDLVAGTDSGVSETDDITNMTRLVFSGTSVPLSVVTVYDETGRALGSTTATDGTWAVTVLPLDPGVHQITADATDGTDTSSRSAARTITIDTTPPEAQLSYTPSALTSGSVTVIVASVSELGTRVTNNGQSDTHSFTRNGTFTFELMDTAGNVGTAVATVRNIDLEAPVITLNGDAMVSLTVGDAFTDPGAVVTDDVASTTTVLGTGTVDTLTSGTYVLAYDAVDGIGNHAITVTRTVAVSAAPAPSTGGGGGGSTHHRSSRSGGSVTAAPSTAASVPVTALALPAGEVLGASTYEFTRDLGVGASGADVTELQAILIASGYLAIPGPTGWYGPMTQMAVKLYQSAHGISFTGYAGPLTRAALNSAAKAATAQ